ncbi:MAG: hypothetical protein ACTSWY_11575 [Promethearchaeota archaeon]
MKPPVCIICGKDCETGKLIYFKLRLSDRKWHEKMERINGIGHPPEAEWFCCDHCERASELSDLTIDKALRVLKDELKN